MKKILLVCIILMVLIGCKKQVVKVAPSINSVPSTSSITGTTATIGGSISDDGGDPITSRGVVYGLNPNPTISDSKTSDGTGIGSFSSIVSGLAPGKTYYFRTYATNSIGTSYGDQITLTSPAVMSTISTTAASAITSTTATSGGNVTADGGSPITARGVCWGTTANPTTSGSKTNDGTGTGSFTSAITGLSPGVTYYARAYATNSIGTSYGDQITIAATAVMATITTTAATLITTSTATSGGNITAEGGATVTARGVCWSTSSTPTTANSFTSNGTGSGSFASLLTNLSQGTTYYIRAYATNSAGTVYGTAVSFTTTPSVSIPTLTATTTLSAITMTTATTGGTISSDGGASIMARGVCWNTVQNPTIANYKTNDNTGVGSFTSIITCLAANTTYYVRAYATNSAGTVYGSELAFTTQQVSQLTVTDIDGNVYHTVTIGTQVWMVENLKTTKYRNGVAIGTTTPATLSILSESMPKYQWAYGGNESNVAVYGRLYTWNAVNDSRKIAPTGWHVPTDAEWTILINYLGGETVAGGKLKQACSVYWNSPNVGTTNETGFTALAGGERWEDGTFYGIGGTNGYWWSSTESANYMNAWYRNIGPNRDISRFDNFWSRGYSVRCIKD